MSEAAKSGGGESTAPTPAEGASAPKAESTPLKADDLEPYKTPPGEMYFIQLWHSGLIFVIALLLHIPFLIDDVVRPTYPLMPKTGAIVVTGAGSGIGQDTAIALAKDGYTVFATVRSNEQVKALKAIEDVQLTPLILDITKEKDVEKAAKDIGKTLEGSNTPLIALVNNAGVAQRSPVEFHDLKEVQKIFDVNVFGTLKLTQKLLPLLRQSQGRIINVSSLLGRLSVPGYGMYGASKAALESFSDALRRELLPLNVSVSLIEPGYVKTPLHDKTLASEKAGQIEAGAVYPHLYSETALEDKERRAAKGSSTQVVVKAVKEALTSSSPKPRYPVANVDDFPASFLAWATRIFPDRLLDHLLTRD